MKTIAIIISLLTMGSVFAANTCHKVSDSAWGVEQLNQADTNKVTPKYRIECDEVSRAEAIAFATEEYSSMTCQPEGNVDFSKLLVEKGNYSICTGSYNYYNWYEENIRVIKSLNNPDFNLLFASAWEE